MLLLGLLYFNFGCVSGACCHRSVSKEEEQRKERIHLNRWKNINLSIIWVSPFWKHFKNSLHICLLVFVLVARLKRWIVFSTYYIHALKDDVNIYRYWFHWPRSTGSFNSHPKERSAGDYRFVKSFIVCCRLYDWIDCYIGYHWIRVHRDERICQCDS